MELKTIAHIHTDFPEKFGIPRQSGLIPSLVGRIVFEPEYRSKDALRGLEEFSHIWLLWGFSESKKENWAATVAPPRLGGRKRMGVFATRAPYRPNPIGLSSVKLLNIEYNEKLGPIIIVSGIDMLDNTPIYDIKPYLSYSDCHEDSSSGFSKQTYNHRLNVIFCEELIKKINPDDLPAIKEILSEDPRTAFINDENRLWGVSYKNYNIRFKVCGNTLTVYEVDLL